MILDKGRGFLNKSIVEKLMSDKSILAFSDLDMVLGLNTWIKAEATRRVSDRNLKFIKFDFLAMLMSELANVRFRGYYAAADDRWKQVALMDDHWLSDGEKHDRLASLRERFEARGIKTELKNTSATVVSWHLSADMRIPVELSYLNDVLHIRIPYQYNPFVAWGDSRQSCYSGFIYVPYTDEQLVQVLIMAADALPQVEKKVLDTLTNMLSGRTARDIQNIRSYAAICGVMDESGLSYTARQTSRGIRVSIPVGEGNVLSFRVRKNDEGFSNAEMIREAAEAAEKFIRLLGPAAKLDRIGTIREPVL